MARDPTLRYQNAEKRSSSWLTPSASRPTTSSKNDQGLVEHAELSFQDGMVMLGSTGGSEFGRLLTTASEAGKPTQGIYVIVDDVIEHAAKAAAAGAIIVMQPTLQDYGWVRLRLVGAVWISGGGDPKI